MTDLHSPLSVVMHDAGATNLIVAWLYERPELDIRFSVHGPAKKIVSQIYPGAINHKLNDAVSNSDCLITGTSRISQVEHEARLIAKQNSVYSIAVVDHWVNYDIRFHFNGGYLFPDAIWVCDEFAYAEAIKFYPKDIVFIKENSFLKQSRERINNLIKENSYSDGYQHILYVLEPYLESWDKSETTGEFLALDYFVQNLNKLGLDRTAKIRLRPHPTDIPGKYDDWCNKYTELHIEVDTISHLHECIAWSDLVVGCETYALIIALEAGKRTYCSLPPNAPPSRLPYKNIINIKDVGRT